MYKRVARLCVAAFILSGGAASAQAQANHISGGDNATIGSTVRTLETSANDSLGPSPLPQTSASAVEASRAANTSKSQTLILLPASGPKAGEGVVSFVAMLIVLIAIKYRGLIV
ncbi:hypothetical protein DSM21852_41740 [Methylocystis bryophila]|uniref:Uncharacterized protein n=1 Tax=Methylocystis bryophila TaxID=655015 RepID=A0A1W6MTJ1_9HYPH|nr:hypothetical protein B1812_06825 [Methylocystis bryophila]BDV40921.1 hypothetical protein DSM21852_41740 [Methylocystis bryophila]